MKFLVPAAVASLLAASAASAQPPVSLLNGLDQSTSPEIIQVQRRDRDDRDDNARRGDNRRFVPGRRYRETPPGWRRHGYRRPGDWRTRGCILVGPLWFCP